MISETAWGRLAKTRVVEELNTNAVKGLSEETIGKRLKEFGANTLTDTAIDTVFDKALRQLKNPLVFILILAGVGTVVLQEYIDAAVIAIAIAINVLIGTLQEERADKAFEKLAQSQTHTATVIRGGKRITIPAEKIVPGDFVILEGGGYVPADIRLVTAKNLAINEAALTGEWVSVPKESGVQRKEGLPLAEQFNMAWMGTLVSGGYGEGFAVATGDRSQVGKIAQSLTKAETRNTPLQENIKNIAKFLIYIVAFFVGLIFLIGVLRGEMITELFLIAIALSVAAMPEGLPAAVTVVLAIGMEAILKEGGLVRNLLAAETLGSTTTILTDKTGTLTQAKMQLADLATLTKEGYDPDMLSADQRSLLEGAIFASDAFTEENEEGELIIHGRPIEKAILKAGLDAGLSQKELSRGRKRLDFLAFESKRRFGASLNNGGEQKRFYISGAPETLLKVSTHTLKDGELVKITAAQKSAFEKAQKTRANEGMRLIAVAYRDTDWKKIPKGKEDYPNKKDAEKLLGGEIVFLGLMAFEDPVREEVADSIAKVTEAGVRVVMVTGDNAQTARTIAKKVGICSLDDRVITGGEIALMDDEELFHAMKTVAIFARVLPDQKLRIARVLKNKGEIVAMTGDGINDAPALRSADIGVAVGSGTEVAKEASDIILINNSFSIIVASIRVGRRIIDNLRKIVAHLLSTNFSGIFIIAGSLFAGLPLPVLPAQILWANIIEEGFLSFAFSFEPEEKGVMKRNPRSANAKQVLTAELKRLIVIVSVITGSFLFALYLFLINLTDLPLKEIRTIMFVSLSLDALFFAFSLKSLTEPIWRINIFNNRYLLGALALSIALLIGALTWPPLQILLSLEPLHAFDFIILTLVGIFNLLIIELSKLFFFKRA